MHLNNQGYGVFGMDWIGNIFLPLWTGLDICFAGIVCLDCSTHIEILLSNKYLIRHCYL